MKTIYSYLTSLPVSQWVYLFKHQKVRVFLIYFFLGTGVFFSWEKATAQPAYFSSGDFTPPNNSAATSAALMNTIVGTFMFTTKANSFGPKYFKFYSAPNAGATIYGPSLSHYFVQKDQIENLNTPGNTTYGYWIFPTSTTSNIIFKTDAANRVMVFEILGGIRTISTVVQSPAASVYPGQSVKVTVTTNATLNTGQGVYLRYAPNSNYANSSVVAMSQVSGNTYAGTIPASVNLANTTQSYYVFSSGNSTPNGSDADLATINLNNNAGANYSYTVLPGWITANNGNWSTAATWTANSVPSTSVSMGNVTMNHNVTMDQNAVMNSMTIASLKTLNQNTGITLATSGGITNNGAYNVNGAGILQFNSGGYISVNAPTFGTGSTLIYNNGGTFNRNIEWGNTAGNPGYPWHVKVQNGTSLYLGVNPVTPATLEIGGDLIIGTATSGSNAVYLDGLAKPLTVLGNLTIGNAATTANRLWQNTSGASLYLYGNFTRYTSLNYYEESLPIYFKGSANQQISTPNGGAAQKFDYAYIDKTTGTETITISTPLYIKQQITFTKGIVNTDATNLLTIEATAATSVIGGSILSFVNGPLKRYTSTSTAGKYIFPVGKTGTPNLYKELSLTTVNNLASGSNFTGEYFPSLPPTSGSDFFAGMLLGIVNTEYWQLDRNAGTTTGLVTIPYTDPTGSNWRDVTGAATSPCWNCNVAVVKRSANSGAGIWDFTSTAGNFSTFSTPPEYRAYNDAGDMITREVSAFGPFTSGLAYTNILPLKLEQFNGRLENTGARLDWKITSVQGLTSFEVQHSTDGRNYSKLDEIQDNNGTTYTYLHPNLAPGIHYYRLLVKEKTGKTFYSQVVLLGVGKVPTRIVGLTQTVVKNELKPIIFSSSNQRTEAIITDALGRRVISRQTQLQNGQNQWQINTHTLAAGFYFITILTSDGTKQTLRFVKE